MNETKVLSSLSYFSIFFAPFILPLIVFFASSNEITKGHAKRAFLSHLIPVIAGIIVFFIIFVFAFNSSAMTDSSGPFIAFILIMIVYAILSLGITIWNIVQGIRVLR